jgi:hypothetical protein
MGEKYLTHIRKNLNFAAMYKITDYKKNILEWLQILERGATFFNRAGYFDSNKDAEEFYRGLLNLFFGWQLKGLNSQADPNYEGADLGDANLKIAVQITSENSSEKVHHSIRGFKNKSQKEGYNTLYVLMYRGKGSFPRAAFDKTVNKAFEFDKDKHIIDHSDLSAQLKDAESAYIEAIYHYLSDKMMGSYAGLDVPVEDLGIIDDIIDHLLLNAPKRVSGISEIVISEIFTKLKVKVPLNFPDTQRKRISEIMLNTWDKQQLVSSYLADLDEQSKIIDLKEIIQQNYCQIRGVGDPETPIQDVKWIEMLALGLLQPQKRLNPHYQANAKAIILCFFEFCYIGEKTIEEKQLSLF